MVKDTSRIIHFVKSVMESASGRSCNEGKFTPQIFALQYLFENNSEAFEVNSFPGFVDPNNKRSYQSNKHALNNSFLERLLVQVGSTNGKDSITQLPIEWIYQEENKPPPGILNYSFVPVDSNFFPNTFLLLPEKLSDSFDWSTAFYQLDQYLYSQKTQELFKLLKNDALIKNYNREQLVKNLANKFIQQFYPLKLRIAEFEWESSLWEELKDTPYWESQQHHSSFAEIEIHYPIPIRPFFLSEAEFHPFFDRTRNFAKNIIHTIRLVLERQQRFTPFSKDHKLSNQVLKQLTDYQNNIQELNQFNSFLSSYLKASQFTTSSVQNANLDSENHFYKSSNAWFIKFNGRRVRMLRNSEKGLRYLHQLLSNPGKEFSAYVIEATKEVPFNKDELETHLQFHDNFSVVIDNKFSKKVNYTKNELLLQLKNLTDKQPDEEDPVEEKIYHYANLIFLIKNLLQLEFRKQYSNLLDIYTDQFELHVAELRRKSKLNKKMKTVIRNAKIIKTHVDDNPAWRRLRQRVNKAVRSAIDNMDQKDIQDHLNATIKTGSVLAYYPYRDQEIDWQLYLD